MFGLPAKGQRRKQKFIVAGTVGWSGMIHNKPIARHAEALRVDVVGKDADQLLYYPRWNMFAQRRIANSSPKRVVLFNAVRIVWQRTLGQARQSVTRRHIGGLGNAGSGNPYKATEQTDDSVWMKATHGAMVNWRYPQRYRVMWLKCDALFFLSGPNAQVPHEPPQIGRDRVEPW
jgi:hypothetical protein